MVGQDEMKYGFDHRHNEDTSIDRVDNVFSSSFSKLSLKYLPSVQEVVTHFI
mgnify:CR=1 FL=1